MGLGTRGSSVQGAWVSARVCRLPVSPAARGVCLGVSDSPLVLGRFLGIDLGLADDKDGNTGSKGGMTGSAGAVVKGLRLVVVWGLSIPRTVSEVLLSYSFLLLGIILLRGVSMIC